MKPEPFAPLQGPWHITALEVDGQTMPGDGTQITVKGERFVAEGMGGNYEGKLTIDTSQKPWAIDLHFTKGPEKGNVNHGIFEMAGDSWRLCLQMTGQPRPTKFATRPGSGLALETLARAKPGAGKNSSASPSSGTIIPSDFPTEPVPELEGEWAMTSCSQNGSPLPAGFLKGGRRIAQGNETTVLMQKQIILQARYAVDQSKQPHTMDYLLTYGPFSGQRQLGIFEQKGDTFKVAFAQPGQPRPTDFLSTPGDGRTVTGWKLVKK